MASKLSEKYIAGFLDADGSIGLTFPKNCSRPQLSVSFSQKTSQDKVLYLIQEVSGGTISERMVNGVSYSKLQLYGTNAKGLLNRIKKHLVVKRHYAHVCLDLANRPVEDPEVAKAYLKAHRRVKSMPLPNFPPRKWLAGYFDGDGCVSVTRIYGPTGRADLVVHVAASDYDTEGIEILQKAYGGRIHEMCDGRVRQWVLSLSASKATEFFGYFAKHLVTKGEQADFVLGCAAMGHFRDGSNIKAALKSLKAHDHRLSEPTEPAIKYLAKVRDLEKAERTKESYLPKHRRSDATVETSASL